MEAIGTADSNHLARSTFRKRDQFVFDDHAIDWVKEGIMSIEEDNNVHPEMEFASSSFIDKAFNTHFIMSKKVLAESDFEQVPPAGMVQPSHFDQAKVNN